MIATVKRIISVTVFMLSLTGVVFSGVSLASGYNRSMEGKGSGVSMGSENSHGGYALDGYCPVAIHKGMYLKGNDHFVTEYNGKVYKFVKFEAQKAFLENPEIFLKDVDKKYKQLKMSKGAAKPKGSY